MRYHYEIAESIVPKSIFSDIYHCEHPVYSECTLYKMNDYGLAVIQQYINEDKSTYWSSIIPTLADDIYRNSGFILYFKEHAGICTDGIYPTVTVRKLMWALRMKPIKKERWETTFDRTFA